MYAVLSLSLLALGNMIEYTYKDSMSKCLKSKKMNSNSIFRVLLIKSFLLVLVNMHHKGTPSERGLTNKKVK